MDHRALDVPAPEIVAEDVSANSASSPTESPAGNGANGDHHLVVDADGFKNMWLAIGTLFDRTISKISLSDNLAAGGTMHIEIYLRQNNTPPAGGGVAPVVQAAAPGNQEVQEQQQAAPPPDEPGDDADEKKYLDRMSGWLMTAATLVVGITFQAAIQPPEWVQRVLNGSDNNGSAAAASAPSPQPANQGATTTADEFARVLLYVVFNLITLGTSLGVVLGLLGMRKTSSAKYAVRLVNAHMTKYSTNLALTFATAMSNTWGILVAELLGIALLAAVTVVSITFSKEIISTISRTLQYWVAR